MIKDQQEKTHATSFIKELIGSMVFFSSLPEFTALVEDKLESYSGWDWVKVVEYNSQRDSFVNLEIPRGIVARGVFDFYYRDERPIQEIIESGNVKTYEVLPTSDSPFERILYQKGARSVCLAPIFVKDKFSGVISAYSRREMPLPRTDLEMMEIASEIVAVSFNFYSKDKDIKELQKEIKDNQNQLINQESLKIVGELNAGIAHQLNNILAGILGYIHLIKLQITDSGLRHLVGEVENAALIGKDTIRSLQLFKKIDFDEEFGVVELDELVSRAIQIAKPRWQDEAWAKNIEYKLETGIRSIPPVMGNSSSLLEAILIVIFNILDAIPLGGKLIIETFQDRNSVGVSFYGQPEKSRMSGYTLYDPFFQSEQGEEPSANIKVASEILRRHQGSLTTESKISGEIFANMKIPVLKNKTERQEMETSMLDKIKANILVVEDELIVRSLLRDVLSQHGFTVSTAEDGLEALSLLKDKDFDLMITDLGMPFMSGFDLAIKAKEISPDIPVILATGWEARIDKRKMEEYKIDYVIGKPFQYEEILETIKKCILKRKG